MPSFTRGYKTVATRAPLRDYPGVISELITISRSSLVKAYAVIIVIAVCTSPGSDLSSQSQAE
jgi:hypothetical protein